MTENDGTGPFATPHRSEATLSAGTPVNLDQDFGYVGSGSIGNFVWLDTNANGIVDGSDASQGIEGVTIDLYDDANRNGRVDAGDIKLATTTTDANGGYLFTGLPTEDIDQTDAYYVVNVTDTAGVLTGYWHSLGDQGVTSDNTSKASPYPVVLATGSTATENVLTVDFGYYVEPGAVGNYVWYDTDKDGVQDPSEVGFNGITVTAEIRYPGADGILNTPDDTVTTVTTLTQTEPGGTRDGWYSFGNLLQDEDYNGIGTYGAEPTHTITVTIPAGFTSSPLGAGTPTTDSDDPTGTSAQPFKGQTNTMFANDSASISSYDFGIHDTTTAIDVSPLKVKATNANSVKLNWKTYTEHSIAGFNVQRSESAGENFANVNSEFIGAKNPGGDKGNKYTFTDATATSGIVYWYRLEIVRTDNSIEYTDAIQIQFGSAACVGTPFQVQLQLPAKKALLDKAKAKLEWSALNCDVTYNLRIRQDSPKGETVLRKNGISKTEFVKRNLERGKTYVWRVIACDANNVCTSSPWRTFSIKE